MEPMGGGPRVPEEPIAARLCLGGWCISSRRAPPGHCLLSACLAPAGPRSARGALSPPGSTDTAVILCGRPGDPCPLGMAQPGVSVKSLVSSFETRVVGMAPGPPRKRGCVSSPCSPRGASPIRGAPGPPPHRGLGGPGQRPSPRRGMDKTLLSLILYCHRYRLGCGWEAAAVGLWRPEPALRNIWKATSCGVQMPGLAPAPLYLSSPCLSLQRLRKPGWH